MKGQDIEERAVLLGRYIIEKNATEKRRLKHVRQNKSCARVQGLKLFTVNFIIMKSAERSAMLLYCTSMSSFYADFSCPAYVG